MRDDPISIQFIEYDRLKIKRKKKGGSGDKFGCDHDLGRRRTNWCKNVRERIVPYFKNK